MAVGTISSWLPFDRIELVVLLLGSLMGVVFVFSSWRGSTKGLKLKDDPRVQSLGWGLAGFLATVIADWESLLGEPIEDKAGHLAFYAASFVGVIIVSVSLTALVLFRRFSRLKRLHLDDYPPEPFTPVTGHSPGRGRNQHAHHQAWVQPYDCLTATQERHSLDGLALARVHSFASSDGLRWWEPTT